MKLNKKIIRVRGLVTFSKFLAEWVHGFTILFIAVALTNCKTKETVLKDNQATDLKNQLGRLSGLMEQDLLQRFTVNTTTQVVIKGLQGTIIKIDPKNLEAEDGGISIGKNITIELKELIDQYDLAKADAQTISNGQLLISGGAYYLNITSEGKKT